MTEKFFCSSCGIMSAELIDLPNSIEPPGFNGRMVCPRCFQNILNGKIIEHLNNEKKISGQEVKCASCSKLNEEFRNMKQMADDLFQKNLTKQYQLDQQTAQNDHLQTFIKKLQDEINVLRGVIISPPIEEYYE